METKEFFLSNIEGVEISGSLAEMVPPNLNVLEIFKSYGLDRLTIPNLKKQRNISIDEWNHIQFNVEVGKINN